MNKPRIRFVYRFNYLNEVLPHLREPGRAPMDFLYGMNAVDERRFETSYVNAPQGPRADAWRRFFYPFEWLITWFSRLGCPFELPFLFPQLKTDEILFGVNDAIGFALLFWKRLGVIKGRVYLIAQGAHERCRKHFRVSWLTRRFIGWLLRAADGVFVLAQCARLPIADYFGVDQSRIHYFPFVGDGDFWTPAPTEAREDFLMSIGNDFNRDYRTLVNALRADEHAVIITAKPVATEGKQVEVKNGLSNEAVRDHFRRAAAVIIPSEHVVFESAGYSSAFQAALTGAPLIVSDSPPMREVFTEWEQALFYEAENAVALRRVLDRAAAHPDEMHAMGMRARERMLALHRARPDARTLENVISR